MLYMCQSGKSPDMAYIFFKNLDTGFLVLMFKILTQN